jgi:hypothetical protein
MTNRQAHEKAAGMNLDDAFFAHAGIDPDAEAPEEGDFKPFTSDKDREDFYEKSPFMMASDFKPKLPNFGILQGEPAATLIRLLVPSLKKCWPMIAPIAAIDGKVALAKSFKSDSILEVISFLSKLEEVAIYQLLFARGTVGIRYCDMMDPNLKGFDLTINAEDIINVQPMGSTTNAFGLRKQYSQIENDFINMSVKVNYDYAQLTHLKEKWRPLLNQVAKGYGKNLPDIDSTFMVCMWEALHPTNPAETEYDIKQLTDIVGGVPKIIIPVIGRVMAKASYDKLSSCVWNSGLDHPEDTILVKIHKNRDINETIHMAVTNIKDEAKDKAREEALDLRNKKKQSDTENKEAK